jgi:hypothetical protein
VTHAYRRQQIPHQPIVRGGTDRQHLWVIAMELLPQSVGSAPELDFQFVFKPGKLTQAKQLGAINVYLRVLAVNAEANTLTVIRGMGSRPPMTRAARLEFRSTESRRRGSP